MPPAMPSRPRARLSAREQKTVARAFFSSRRRHTRSLRDWNSDVCSSDLSPCCTESGGSGRTSRRCEVLEQYRQGEVLLTRVEALPEGEATEPVPATGGR